VVAVNVTSFTRVGLTINVTVDAVLFPITGSGWVAPTVAVFLAESRITAVTVMVMVAVAPLAIVPREHVTVPVVWEHVPREGVAET
jgi:hypothetical protein